MHKKGIKRIQQLASNSAQHDGTRKAKVVTSRFETLVTGPNLVARRDPTLDRVPDMLRPFPSAVLRITARSEDAASEEARASSWQLPTMPRSSVGVGTADKAAESMLVTPLQLTQDSEVWRTPSARTAMLSKQRTLVQC